MGIAARPPLGLLDADTAHRVDRARPRFLQAQAFVKLERFGDLVAYRENRIQRRHRLLEDDGYVAPAKLVQLVRGHGEHAPAFEANLAGQPRRFDEPQERKRRDRLAGP
jgi:hypothetical protein